MYELDIEPALETRLTNWKNKMTMLFKNKPNYGNFETIRFTYKGCWILLKFAKEFEGFHFYTYRIFYPDIREVWIERENLQPFATRDRAKKAAFNDIEKDLAAGSAFDAMINERSVKNAI